MFQADRGTWVVSVAASTFEAPRSGSANTDPLNGLESESVSGARSRVAWTRGGHDTSSLVTRDKNLTLTER